MSSEPSLPLRTFEAMQLSEPLRRALVDVGYTTPTDVQTATFDLIAAGRDVIIQSKTGSGKTAAFAVPLLDRIVRPEPRVQVLTLCPTRELALQVAGEFARLGKHTGLATSAVYGGASIGKQIDELAAGAQVVVGTPGRVLDHLRRRTFDPSGLRVFVLDEADEMLSMGFAEELHAIMEMLPKKRQGLLFSATMPESVQRIARRHLTDPEFISLSTDQVSPTEVEHYVYFVGLGNRTRELARIVEIERPDAAIVFCNTKEETERAAGEMQKLGFAADWLNGDLAQNDRERVMASLREGRIKYLVATDVAARGIDVTGISHVFNYGFPESPEQYVHRTGRTGRAGRKGVAISLITPRDVGNLYFLRLTYAIRPIERALPSAVEENTQREADRIQMMREAFSGEPSDDALSLARRLIAHDAADVLVAGLLTEFFAMATRDALVRASNPPTQPGIVSRARPGPTAPTTPAAPATPSAQTSAKPPFTSPTGGSSSRSRGPRRDERPAPVGRAPANPVERPRRVDVHHADGPDDDESVEVGMEELRLATGKRDGVRAGELARFVREKAGLGRRDVGRVFVRDRFTLISVRMGTLEKTIATLRDSTFGGIALNPERGRGLGMTIAPPAVGDEPTLVPMGEPVPPANTKM